MYKTGQHNNTDLIRISLMVISWLLNITKCFNHDFLAVSDKEFQTRVFLFQEAILRRYVLVKSGCFFIDIFIWLGWWILCHKCRKIKLHNPCLNFLHVLYLLEIIALDEFLLLLHMIHTNGYFLYIYYSCFDKVQ